MMVAAEAAEEAAVATSAARVAAVRVVAVDVAAAAAVAVGVSAAAARARAAREARAAGGGRHQKAQWCHSGRRQRPSGYALHQAVCHGAQAAP